MDNGKSGSREQSITVFASCERVKIYLRELRDIKRLPWHKIANLSCFKGIPVGTLYDIYSGKPISRKWLWRFGLPRPRPPRIAIRLDNPESAARSIMKHMGSGLIGDLVNLLKEGI